MEVLLARLARLVIPGLPYHVTQRGNRRRYARRINARYRWTGHLWQGRFGAVVMDEAHLVHAARYVSR